jgi:hypothetical protein
VKTKPGPLLLAAAMLLGGLCAAPAVAGSPAVTTTVGSTVTVVQVSPRHDSGTLPPEQRGARAPKQLHDGPAPTAVPGELAADPPDEDWPTKDTFVAKRSGAKASAVSTTTTSPLRPATLHLNFHNGRLLL